MRFFNRRHKAFDRVPDFPLRCQHCEKSIQLSKTSHPVQYRDEDGLFMCEAEVYLPHRPMPSVSRLK